MTKFECKDCQFLKRVLFWNFCSLDIHGGRNIKSIEYKLAGIKCSCPYKKIER